MEVKLRLFKSEIMKAAKDETYLSGKAVLAADGSNAEVVYNMQAGDDDVHEAKLLRSLRVGLDSLKSQLTGFVRNAGEQTGNNVSDTMVDDLDYFDITLDVSTRFNKGYVDSLASMASSYITDYTVATWWIAVNPTLAANYYTSANNMLLNIRKCFVKMPPRTPVYKYPQGLSVRFPDGAESESDNNGAELEIGRSYPISYSVYGETENDTDVVDDVLIKSSDPSYIRVEGVSGDYTMTRLKAYGLSKVMLYSKHDPTLNEECVIESRAE